MKRALPLVVGVLVFTALIVGRAVVIPMTHDEASTWLNYRYLDVWSCLSNPSCWGTANNHWLNTLLLQWSAGIFGDIPWAIRLPNVIAGFLYMVGAALFLFRYVKNILPQCCAFLLLCGHMYLLDFFSLARGYGLMACGMMWSVYAIMRYIERYEFRWLVLCVLSLVLAILANFTALLPWAAVGAGWGVWLVTHKKSSLLLRHGMVWVSSALVLFLVLKYPIKTLSGSGEFEWGATGPWAMMIDLMHNLLYGARYLGEHTALFVLWLLIILSLFLLVAVVFDKKQNKKDSLYLSVILLVMNLIVIVILQQITGAQPPVGRKAIFLIPFIFIIPALGFNLIRNKTTRIALPLLVSVAFFYHMGRSYPWASTREWYYDAYYPELLSTLFAEESSSDSIRLGSSWIFNPALSFYQKTTPLPVSGLVYQKQLVIDTTMQYYYVESGDSTGMHAAGFVLQKNIGPFFLFNRPATFRIDQ